MNLKQVPFLVFLAVVFSACASAPVETLTVPTNHPLTATQVATLSPSPSATITSTPTVIVRATETPLPTQTSTLESTASPVPTYAILSGVVLPDKLSCRYGPGAMYLYLYGMVKGANQEIIGRTDSGKWVLTRSRGDNKACWVKTEFMQLNGDVMSVEMVYPEKYHIPQSNQGYRSPWDVVALRNGNQVTVSWKSEALRAGDEESATSVLYVLEVWVCQNGELVFTPIGAYVGQASVTDEPGCAQPSHGRVFFSEKHGYAGPSEITWPPAK